MTDPRPAESLDLPPLHEVEAILGLQTEDRGDLPGLHRLNAHEVPRTRFAGYQLLLAFVLLHNLLRDVGVSWTGVAVVGVVFEVYAVAQWWLLRTWFARSKRVHLGTVFLALDLPVWTLAIYATGADQSLLWPVYLLRVADQIWIGRVRAVWMGALGATCYLALLGWVVVVDGARPDLLVETAKVATLVAFTLYLVMASRGPWNVQIRTQAAKSIILRLKQQSAELDGARRRAEEASRAKSDFLARMSHELRTPLNSVVGFTNLLLKRGPDPEDRWRDYLTRIRRNGMHRLAVINDLLDIARIEEGRLDLHPTQVDVGTLVRDTVAQLEGRIQGGNVSISVDAPPSTATVVADEARLRQVLINLVGNAIKFTPSGWIRVEVVCAEPDGRPTRIAVSDTGIGIPAHRLDGIFTAFEQAEGGTARRYGGTGLGLAISRVLCKRMGFRLDVESVVDQGSTFTVVLADDDDPDGTGPEVSAETSGSAPPPVSSPATPPG